MGTGECVHIPLNFERRQDVRLLVRDLGHFAAPDGREDRNAATSTLGYCSGALYTALAIWMEFGGVGQDWRPLRHPLMGEPAAHPWHDEEITYLLESAVGWHRARGLLVPEALRAGILRIEKRGDVAGIVLNDFARYNAHLLPGYVSMQQKGAAASADSRRRKEDVEAGRQQGRILAAQESLPIFEGQSATREEIDGAITLIMQIDRARGAPARLSQHFTESLIEAGVEVKRKFPDEEIAAALDYLIANRETPAVIKRADFVLSHFAEYVPSNVPRGTKLHHAETERQ